MKRLHRAEFQETSVALALVATGLGVAERGWSYSIGTISSIGPGFFPFGLGTLLALLGAIQFLVAVTGRTVAEEADEPFPWRPAVMISLGMAAWILLLKPYGLVPATVALVVITSLAEAPLRPLAVLTSAISISAATSILFVYILRMPLAVISW